MAKRTWILTDVERDVYVEAVDICPSDVDGAADGYAVRKRRLRGGPRDGVDVIEVDNGDFRFTVIPTRGMGIWRASLGNVQLGWQSPVHGPVNPGFVPLVEPSGLGWLDGFDELLVRCGLQSNGAPVFNPDGSLAYPLHGRVANLPAHRTEVTIDGDTGEIAVTGVVDEARLFFDKLRLTATYKTRPGQPGFMIVDTVSNISAEPGEMQLLYHINFGAPLLDAGSKLVVPAAKVSPRDDYAAEHIGNWDTYDPESPGSNEVCNFFDFRADADGRTQALLHNAAGQRGVSVLFNNRQLPCFTQWKCRQAIADGYVTGLEPATNFPNPRSFEKAKGRVVALQPGESRSFELAVEAHDSAEKVNAAREQVATLAGGKATEVLQKPDLDWSPGKPLLE